MLAFKLYIIQGSAPIIDIFIAILVKAPQKIMQNLFTKMCSTPHHKLCSLMKCQIYIKQTDLLVNCICHNLTRFNSSKVTASYLIFCPNRRFFGLLPITTETSRPARHLTSVPPPSVPQSDHMPPWYHINKLCPGVYILTHNKNVSYTK